MGLEKSEEKFYSSDVVKMYITEIKKYPLLTKEEEQDLFYRYKNGDLTLKDTIAKSNLRLVLKVASKFQNQGMSFEDLIQEGNLGLLKAIDYFDIERGTKFSTYAINWIRQFIQRALENHGKNIRIPVHLLEKISLYKKKKEKLRNLLQEEPTIEIISYYLNMPIEQIIEFENYLTKSDTISLNQDLKNDEKSSTLEDFIVSNEHNPEKCFIESELSTYIDQYMVEAGLNEREQYIIIHRFGLRNQVPKTLEAIGKKFGFSRERVRQIEKKALNKLKLAKNIQQLSIYTNNPQNSENNILEFRKQYYLNLNKKK